MRLITIMALTSALLLGQQPQRGNGGQQGRQGGGPPGIFHTDVPAHDLDVVQARPTANSITLSLLALRGGEATLSYTPSSASPQAVSLRPGVPLSVEVANLQPGLEYHYTVQLAGNAAPVQGTFHTAPAAPQDFVFGVQADSHLDDNCDPRVYANTLHNVVADHAAFLMDLGDTFMNDKRQDYHDAAPQYLAQRYYFGIVGAAMPVYLVLGNHDGEVGWHTRGDGNMTAWSGEMRRRYFPPVITNSFYTAGPQSADYYAWTWADALFVVLDPFTQTHEKPRSDDDGWAWTLGRQQYDWLQKTLAASHAHYKFVFIHHLVGGGDREARGGSEASTFYEWGGHNPDGSNGFAAHRSGWAMPIHDLLVANHVTAVFHGHDHLYVHQQRDGIDYQEVPQPSQARGGNINSAAEYGYHAGTLLGSSGHIRVSINARNATVAYVKSELGAGNAKVADQYTLQPFGGKQ